VTFVLDTNVFIVLTHFYPSSFPTLWARLDELVLDGTIVSVREVYNELKQSNDSGFLQEWIDERKHIFARPSNAELLMVRRILAVPHFQTLIGVKAVLKGTPVADPFVVAAAKIKGGTVVTQEKLKPTAARIPNVCDHFEVPCMDLQTFMRERGWTF
jgi:hypothetical protein